MAEQKSLDRQELLRRLARFEWSDLEFKAAQHEVPKDAYKTVSAFANSTGGHLVFGVREVNGRYEVLGVKAIDKVQNDFLGTVRIKGKLSAQIDTVNSVLELEDKTLLVFYVPEAASSEKPVHLNGDISESFVRRGAGDSYCTPVDLQRFARNASQEAWESVLVKDLAVERAFDSKTLSWYRGQYAKVEPTKTYEDLDNLDFLERFGLIRSSKGERLATRASLLLFGTEGSVQRVCPRLIVDARWFSYTHDEARPEENWDDRLASEENLFETWQKLNLRFVDGAGRALEISRTTGQRVDGASGYLAFREAVVNLLIHQDYAEPLPAKLRVHPDRAILRNPGAAFVAREKLFEPADDKIYRNPLIVSTFSRIKLSERASSGLGRIFGVWHGLGRTPPMLENDHEAYAFQLTLGAKPLMTEAQLLFTAKLGIPLSKHASEALSVLMRRELVLDRELAAALALTSTETNRVFDELILQVVAEVVETADTRGLRITEGLRERLVAAGILPGASSTETARPQLTESQRSVVLATSAPRRPGELRALVGISSQAKFKRQVVVPLVETNLLQELYDGAPSPVNLRYALTPLGVELAEVLRATLAPDAVDEGRS